MTVIPLLVPGVVRVGTDTDGTPIGTCWGRDLPEGWWWALLRDDDGPAWIWNGRPDSYQWVQCRPPASTSDDEKVCTECGYWPVLTHCHSCGTTYRSVREGGPTVTAVMGTNSVNVNAAESSTTRNDPARTWWPEEYEPADPSSPSVDREPAEPAGPYSIGSDHWAGTSKLIEEMGELAQVLGKLIALGGAVDHWDGTNLSERLHEEIADVTAALQFFTVQNGLAREDIHPRIDRKVALFTQWQEEQAAPASPVVDREAEEPTAGPCEYDEKGRCYAHHPWPCPSVPPVPQPEPDEHHATVLGVAGLSQLHGTVRFVRVPDDWDPDTPVLVRRADNETETT